MTKRLMTLLQISTLLLMTVFSFTRAQAFEAPNMTAPIPMATDPIIPIEVKDLLLPEEAQMSLKTQDEDTPFLFKPNAHKAMLEQNQDYTGWIRIPGTQVDYPFVKGQDNDHYLKRDFQGRFDEKGTIFMDHRNIGFQFSSHVILYGHNMRDGSMFGELDLYKTPDFALANDIIVIDDLYGTRYFQVYASYFDGADTSYIRTNIAAADMDSFIDLQRRRSDTDYGLVPDKDDNLLTLITCSYEVDDGRFYVHGKEILYIPHS